MNTKLLKEKIQSVKSIKKITKTMQMVSVAKMRRSTVRALGARTYVTHALTLLSLFAKDTERKHPLSLPGEGKKTLIVLIGGNKGLCGAYHTRLAKLLRKTIDSKEECEIIAVGKYAEKIAQRSSTYIKNSFLHYSEYTSIYQLHALSDAIMNAYVSGGYKEVLVIYTHFHSALTYEITQERLLPAAEDSFNTLHNWFKTTYDISARGILTEDQYVFEPNKGLILDYVLPKLIHIMVYHLVIESFASEHSARMIAMQQATDNAESVIHNLQNTYNTLRQSRITTEIIEVVSGMQAQE